jgi:hypothetical protein
VIRSYPGEAGIEKEYVFDVFAESRYFRFIDRCANSRRRRCLTLQGE